MAPKSSVSKKSSMLESTGTSSGPTWASPLIMGTIP
jgi:hypothetical protein